MKSQIKYDLEKLINNAKLKAIEIFGLDGHDAIVNSGNLYGNIQSDVDEQIYFIYDATKQMSHNIEHYLPKLLKSWEELRDMKTINKYNI